MGTMAIFGSGTAVNGLKQVAWLKEKEIFYWGDIDVQGFEMLSAVRGIFSQTKSMLMDKTVFTTFTAHHATGPKSNINQLSYLNREEEDLYYYLKGLTQNNRLEQERIPNWYVVKQISDQLR